MTRIVCMQNKLLDFMSLWTQNSNQRIVTRRKGKKKKLLYKDLEPEIKRIPAHQTRCLDRGWSNCRNNHHKELFADGDLRPSEWPFGQPILQRPCQSVLEKLHNAFRRKTYYQCKHQIPIQDITKPASDEFHKDDLIQSKHPVAEKKTWENKP